MRARAHTCVRTYPCTQLLCGISKYEHIGQYIQVYEKNINLIIHNYRRLIARDSVSPA